MPRPRHFLREWRKKRNLTQDQLGDKLGIYKSVLSRYERGERGITDEMMFRFLDALEITPGQFYAHPDTPSLDALARGLNGEKFLILADFVKTYCERATK